MPVDPEPNKSDDVPSVRSGCTFAVLRAGFISCIPLGIVIFFYSNQHFKWWRVSDTDLVLALILSTITGWWVDAYMKNWTPRRSEPVVFEDDDSTPPPDKSPDEHFTA